MVHAHGFFDESGHEDQPGYFAIGGFAGSEDQWHDFTASWTKALRETGAPYLHMREFAHSVEAFANWKRDNDRRNRLMAGVVEAILQSELTAVGSAMRVEDFDSLSERDRKRFVSPYYCCLQDVLSGFALMTDQPVPVEMLVVGDQKHDHEALAKGLYRELRKRSGYTSLAPGLTFADMGLTPGLQAADLLAYEMTKELKNQDSRPEDRMRWPLDRILSDPESPRGKMLRYITKAELTMQAAGKWNEEGRTLVQQTAEEVLRVFRDKGSSAKDRIRNQKS